MSPFKKIQIIISRSAQFAALHDIYHDYHKYKYLNNDSNPLYLIYKDMQNLLTAITKVLSSNYAMQDLQNISCLYQDLRTKIANHIIESRLKPIARDEMANQYDVLELDNVYAVPTTATSLTELYNQLSDFVSLEDFNKQIHRMNLKFFNANSNFVSNDSLPSQEENATSQEKIESRNNNRTTRF